MKDVLMRTIYFEVGDIVETFEGTGIVQKVYDNYKNNIYSGQTLTVLVNEILKEFESYTCISVNNKKQEEK
jgi:uncharacterized protein YkvS